MTYLASIAVTAVIARVCMRSLNRKLERWINL